MSPEVTEEEARTGKARMEDEPGEVIEVEFYQTISEGKGGYTERKNVRFKVRQDLRSTDTITAPLKAICLSENIIRAREYLLENGHLRGYNWFTVESLRSGEAPDEQ